MPRAPALVAGFRETLWLSADGEIEALSPEEARVRLDPPGIDHQGGGAVPIVCHARAVARRLDLAGFAALDVLELFAFVRPAGFCIPTPRGIAVALALPPPGTMADACVALIDATRVLLQELHADAKIESRALGRNRRARGLGLGSGRARFLAAGRNRGDATRRRTSRLAEPAGMAGARPAASARQRPGLADEARRRLASLLGSDAEARPEQADYAAAVAAAFAPRERPDAPRAVLAEAGTGVGKTLGYIAPASLWAEKNQGAVWLSTYTRNLQSQIDDELDRLYPEPAQKRRRVVIRKGRENFLCLLNYEDAARAASARGGNSAAALVLIARWDRRPLPGTWPPAISRAGWPS